MRGLKQIGTAQMIMKERRIFYRCVDWNKTTEHNKITQRSRIFYRCVDWNWTERVTVHDGRSRIFYRCVDWNCLHDSSIIQVIWSHLLQMRGLKRQPGNKTMLFVCRIFYRCVDWNVIMLYLLLVLVCRIFYRCVDWNRYAIGLKEEAEGRIFYRCVDWNSNREHIIDTARLSHLLQMRGLKQRT